MGGAWESLVKVTKKALKSVTNNRPIRENQLVTTLVQIERTITSGFLTSLSDDTDDLTILTQNHFISGRFWNIQAVVNINKKYTDSRRKWKVVQVVVC